MERARQFGTESKDITTCPPVQYPLRGVDEVTVNGKVRETTFEYMFTEDNDLQSVPSMILDAILKCPIDLRKTLAENIVWIGGGVMTLGFKARLRAELLERLQSDRYKEKLHFDQFKFHSPPSKDNYTAWLGGNVSRITLLKNNIFNYFTMRCSSNVNGVNGSFYCRWYVRVHRTCQHEIIIARDVLQDKTSTGLGEFIR